MSTKWPEGYGLITLDSVDSTMLEANRRAATLAGPTWIIAKDQTAAHGRRGRAWANPKGNFAGTLVLQPREAPETVALRSFVAALALFDACVALTGRADAFSLKWPNDVLLHGGKLAGILLASAGQGGRLDSLAIGIGVNLRDTPSASDLESTAVGPTSLQTLGVAIEPDDFALELASAYARRELEFTTYGFGPIREAWLAKAARLGEVITARTVREEYTGSFDGVDASGNLILRTSKGTQAIAAADVYF
ncbi:BirA family transcriptional regulator, biotin operon repressor / biotin-[acetyl-CoA-carboxylase] ligase [Litoreibacter albidus]|uniref:biotin--[biotin carboxyl-carrier protein] ligase n=1 Tax=Litoreibacter albidus TaxID=670155 RepID=A0A1H2RZ95_9RHOB|nr:BirA family transcriptional regulator, biotin operon repressor / biotin-[acetyl-CoA-carboxylase] ligase [Litoreibacter albidus]